MVRKSLGCKKNVEDEDDSRHLSQCKVKIIDGRMHANVGSDTIQKCLVFRKFADINLWKGFPPFERLSAFNDSFLVLGSVLVQQRFLDRLEERFVSQHQGNITRLEPVWSKENLRRYWQHQGPPHAP